MTTKSKAEFNHENNRNESNVNFPKGLQLGIPTYLMQGPANDPNPEAHRHRHQEAEKLKNLQTLKLQYCKLGF